MKIVPVYLFKVRHLLTSLPRLYIRLRKSKNLTAFLKKVLLTPSPAILRTIRNRCDYGNTQHVTIRCAPSQKERQREHWGVKCNYQQTQHGGELVALILFYTGRKKTSTSTSMKDCHNVSPRFTLKLTSSTAGISRLSGV
jgi:hypothetical protein